jgi:hypothetical protein
VRRGLHRGKAYAAKPEPARLNRLCNLCEFRVHHYKLHTVAWIGQVHRNLDECAEYTTQRLRWSAPTGVR